MLTSLNSLVGGSEEGREIGEFGIPVAKIIISLVSVCARMSECGTIGPFEWIELLLSQSLLLFLISTEHNSNISYEVDCYTSLQRVKGNEENFLLMFNFSLFFSTSYGIISVLSISPLKKI